MKITAVYDKLLRHFGPQKWWPVQNNFLPKEWEVCVGAVLTQNTNWSNVEKAIGNLTEAKHNSVEKMLRAEQGKLEELLMPSGFYRQKASRLRKLCEEVMKFGSAELFMRDVSRDHLLSIDGIGKETADSILLYACNKPYFVVDAYTRRVFSRLGMLEERLGYDEIRSYFEKNLPCRNRLETYKEFHALIVKLAKEYCRKQPLCEGCPLKNGCASARITKR